MSNWFRLTPDKSLDRPYLRVCAVYRCATRYGKQREWAISKLSEVMTEYKATRLWELWRLDK